MRAAYLQQAIAKLHTGHANDESEGVLTFQEHGQQSGAGLASILPISHARGAGHMLVKQRAKPIGHAVRVALVSFAVALSVIATLGSEISGGFLEKAGSQALRPRFTRSQIQSFLPANDARGAFRFPPPYNTQGIRLTNASDCGGQDCVDYVGYSYWRNINNHTFHDWMLIVIGMDRRYGGAGPSLFAYNKVTDEVRNLGPLFDPTNPASYATGEGWYFSAVRPSTLYVYLVGTSYLWRYDVITHQAEPALDLSKCTASRVCPSTAAYIFQPHSSDDDQVHSATAQDLSFNRLGCVVSGRNGTFRFYAPPAGSFLDECQIDKSGNWLVLLEVSLSTGAETNRIVNMETGAITTIDDFQGAL